MRLKMLQEGMPLKQIIAFIELSEEEIEKLRQNINWN